MQSELRRPFDSLESTLEFMALLEGMIEEVSKDLERLSAASVSERSQNGIRLAIYKIRQLSIQVHKCRRILNDLTLIRGALAGDHPAHARAAKSV
jgi:hypothetical protein